MTAGRTASALLVVIATAACTSAEPGSTGSDRPSSSTGPSPVPSGVFVSANFHPEVTFRLTPPFDHTRDDPALVTVDGEGPETVNIFDVSEAYDPKTGNLVPAPGDLIAWLRTHPYLDAGAPKAIHVGRWRAVQIDVKVARAPPADSALRCAPGCLLLFQMGLDRLPIAQGGRARFIVVQTDATSVVIEFEAAAAGFGASAAVAQRLINTVRFAPIS